MSLDDRIRQFSDAIIENLRPQIEASIQPFLAQLRETADGERTAAVDEAVAKAAADRQVAVDGAAAEREQAIEALRAELSRQNEEAFAAFREQAAGEREAALADARNAAEALATITLEAVRQERDAARSSAAELTDQLATARAEHEQLVQLAHAESAAAEQSAAHDVEARAEERQFHLACGERLVAAMRDLDAAHSLTEVLNVVADHAAAEAFRAGVLIVQGERLHGWRFSGMGDVQPQAVDIPLDRSGLLGRAVAARAPVSTSDAVAAPGGGLPPFMVPPPDRIGLAVPVSVGGRVVAVLYADNAGENAPPVPSHWPEVAEVLARHAGRCLEVLTFSRAGIAARAAQASSPAPAPPVQPLETDAEREEESARRHARLLVSEVKLYNEALVEQGRREGNLLALLGTEIDRARRLYEEKIPAAVRQRVDCFDEEVVRTLAGGDRAVLGQTP